MSVIRTVQCVLRSHVRLHDGRPIASFPFMKQTLRLLLSTLLIALLPASVGFAQVFDPTAPDAVVEYGGPDPLSIELSDGAVLNFTVELANTPDSQQRGLMHRESMADDAGMLFTYEEERIVGIWMANTLIGLDLLFVRSDGTIAKIVAGAVPMSRRTHVSDVPVAAVLEINAGLAESLNIETGDLVRHTFFGTALEGVSESPSTATETAEGG